MFSKRSQVYITFNLIEIKLIKHNFHFMAKSLSVLPLEILAEPGDSFFFILNLLLPLSSQIRWNLSSGSFSDLLIGTSLVALEILQDSPEAAGNLVRGSYVPVKHLKFYT